jgi:hypothetical protein
VRANKENQMTDDQFLQSLKLKPKPVEPIEVYESLNIEIAPSHYCRQLTWADAKLYAFSLNIDGKIGWRLPCDEEMGCLLENHPRFNGFWYMQYWCDVNKSGRIKSKEYTAWLEPTGLHFQTRNGEYVHNTVFVRDLKDD